MFYTDRQVAILEFLQRFRRMNGKSPTLGEIAVQFQVSKVTVHDHIRQLEAKGAVRKAPHRARALEIIDPDYLDPDPNETRDEGTLPVTILGSIAAGQPIDAIETPETVDLAELLPMGRDHYALRVCGESMIEDGIHDGDLVIVERRTSADDGELVVVVPVQQLHVHLRAVGAQQRLVHDLQLFLVEGRRREHDVLLLADHRQLRRRRSREL